MYKDYESIIIMSLLFKNKWCRDVLCEDCV